MQENEIPTVWGKGKGEGERENCHNIIIYVATFVHEVSDEYKHNLILKLVSYSLAGKRLSRGRREEK